MAGTDRRAVQPVAGNVSEEVGDERPAIWEDSVATTPGSTTRSVTESICSEPGTSPNRISPSVYSRYCSARAGVGIGASVGIGADVFSRIDPARDCIEHDWQSGA